MDWVIFIQSVPYGFLCSLEHSKVCFYDLDESVLFLNHFADINQR